MPNRLEIAGLTNNELLTLSALNIKEMYGYELVKYLAKYETKVLIGPMHNILYRMVKKWIRCV